MCEYWSKKPATVRRRLKKWAGVDGCTAESSLELALEIPEIPGYRFELKIVGLDKKYRFMVSIDPHYKQYAKYDCKKTAKYGAMYGEIFTLEEIKKIFPKNKKAFDKGRMVGLY